MEKSTLIDQSYCLEKFPGKGGWTYALIPQIPQEKRFPFGWLRVNGTIDEFPLAHYKLMPFGNGQLFLPVKAAIRKFIKKEAGDWVHIRLFADEGPKGIPEDILSCLKEAPKAYHNFINLPDWEQKLHIDSMYDAKMDHTQVNRLVLLIKKLDF
ncbi:DUF1905 domain-containing protein [Pararhodonellum marinum]|uniref:DUF1905 domain-containing protein n=1 Tax=Pararhodonellum marinum TaxID=2755358 RepID=UPI00188EAE38|nr:YdeI/OmpD-associated family protein [Pararhodonellum marinum]